MENLTIKIYQSSEADGFYYDIFDGEELENDDQCDSLDGGFCTSTMENALEMATEQAKELILNFRNA